MQDLLETIGAEAVEWRHELHRHPETMHEEAFAAEFISRRLTEWGIPYESGIGGHGIVATVTGQHGDRTVAFRADMDALDIQEATGLPWTSQNPGKMHACGHDGHMATLLALGKYLHETRDFAGTVRLIFQPAEEGGRGAEKMVRDGLLERFPFDEIYGYHNWPYAPRGQFSVRSGFMMAASDTFSIRLTGRGGHAAMPHLGNDVIVAGSHLVSALQALVSREIPAHDAAVLSVTNFHAGTGAANVTPTLAELTGTVRYFESAVGDRLKARLCAMAEGTATMFGVTHEITYQRVIDPVFNPASHVEFVREAVGAEALREQAPIMGSEDFGHFLERRPGAFVFVGQGEADPDSPHNQGLHTPRYDFNDAILPVVARYFARIVAIRLGIR